MKYWKKLLFETELITFLKGICFEISERYCSEFDAIGSDGGYSGTVGDGTTSDIIKNYVENQGNKEEKEAYQQMKILIFNNLEAIALARTYLVACSGVRQRKFD